MNKSDLETLYNQLKQWAVVFYNESDQTKALIAEIWDKGVIKKIFSTIYEQREQLAKIMETLNRNISQWSRIIINVVSDLGGWSEAIGYLQKNLDQWNTWIQKVSTMWQTYQSEIEQLINKWDEIWKIKEKLCSQEGLCKDIWKTMVDKLGNSWESVLQKLKSRVNDLPKIMKFMEKDIGKWQKILQSNKNKLPNLIEKIFEENNWNEINKLFNEDNKNNIWNLWDILSGSPQEAKNSVIKTKGDLREAFFEQAIEKLSKDPVNTVKLLEQLGKALTQSGNSSPGADPSQGTITQEEQVEIDKETLKHLWGVKPGMSLDMYLSAIKALSSIGVKVNDTTSLFARFTANFASTLWNKYV